MIDVRLKLIADAAGVENSWLRFRFLAEGEIGLFYGSFVLHWVGSVDADC